MGYRDSFFFFFFPFLPFSFSLFNETTTNSAFEDLTVRVRLVYDLKERKKERKKDDDV